MMITMMMLAMNEGKVQRSEGPMDRWIERYAKLNYSKCKELKKIILNKSLKI